MTRFVIRRGAAFFFAHHGRATFWPHKDFIFGVFKILHFNQTFVATCGKQGGFVHQIRQIRTREPWRAACNHAGVDIFGDRHFAHVYE